MQTFDFGDGLVLPVTPDLARGYVIYTRRSTSDAVNQQNTIKYQRRTCLDFARQNGLTIANTSDPVLGQNGLIKEQHSAYATGDVTLRDDGTATFAVGRPRFQRLMVMLDRRQIAGVICLSWDRISRNEQDGMIVKRLLKNGRDIRFVQTNYEKTSAGALHMDIDSTMAQHYSRQSSEKITSITRSMIRGGLWPRASPVGYLDKGASNKPHDPERAMLAVRVFEQYATAEWSYDGLAAWGRSQGLTTKPVRSHRTVEERLSEDEDGDREVGRKPQVAHPITRKTIEQMLQNPFYAGYVVLDGELIQGVHKPLISWELYQRCQDVRNGKVRGVRTTSGIGATHAGLVRCVCRRLFSPYEQRSRWYYRSFCRSDCTSTVRNLADASIDAHVLALLDRIAFTSGELAKLEAAGRRRFRTQEADAEAGEATRTRRLERVKADLAYLNTEKVALLRLGTFTPAALRDAVTELEAECLRLVETKRAPTEAPRFRETGFTILELVTLAKECYKSAFPSEKRDLWRNMILELELRDGNLVAAKGKGPFDALLHRRKWSEWNSGGPELRSLEELTQLSDAMVEAVSALSTVVRRSATG